MTFDEFFEKIRREKEQAVAAADRAAREECAEICAGIARRLPDEPIRWFWANECEQKILDTIK